MFSSEDGNATTVGTVTVCRHVDDATSPLQSQRHYHSLAFDDYRDLIAIFPAVIREEMKSHTYLYSFCATEEVPRIGDMGTPLSCTGETTKQ